MKLASLETWTGRPCWLSSATLLSRFRNRAAYLRRRCSMRSTTGIIRRRRLMRVYDLLNENQAEGAKAVSKPREMRVTRCRVPYQWADGSGLPSTPRWNSCAKPRGAEMPPSFWTDPLMYQGGSDSFHRSLRSHCRRGRGVGPSISRPRSPARHGRCGRWASLRAPRKNHIKLLALVERREACAT